MGGKFRHAGKSRTAKFCNANFSHGVLHAGCYNRTFQLRCIARCMKYYPISFRDLTIWSGMSGVSLKIERSGGRVLIVGSPACRAQPLGVLQRLGYTCAETPDPYSAMLEVCRRPMVYGA